MIENSSKVNVSKLLWEFYYNNVNWNVQICACTVQCTQYNEKCSKSSCFNENLHFFIYLYKTKDFFLWQMRA